jgi:site-specific recombinase XerD
MKAFSPTLDIRISYILRGSYQNEQGKNPIVLRISYRGQRRDIFTGLFCEKRVWNTAENRVSTFSKESQKINQDLQRIHYNVREHFDELRFSGDIFTIDELVSKIKGQEEPPQTLLEYADAKLNDFQERVGLDISITTFYKYRRVIAYLREFLKQKHNISNIAVASVNSAFLNQFFKFLRIEKANSHNSSLTLMNCLRTILRSAIRTGVIRISPFDDFKVGFKNVERDYLITEDINKLVSAEFKSEILERSRDIFLFACYTGLAYSDIKQLSRDHIKLDFDGSYFIKKTRQKTSGMTIVPLLQPAIRILQKYSLTNDPRDFKFNVPCNQTLNRNLKQIARISGINKSIFMHLARHTFATTVTLSNGVPLETVSKMLGHTSLKHTIRYAKVVAEKIKSDMSQVQNIFK